VIAIVAVVDSLRLLLTNGPAFDIVPRPNITAGRKRITSVNAAFGEVALYMAALP
jgi:hypothetical protein